MAEIRKKPKSKFTQNQVNQLCIIGILLALLLLTFIPEWWHSPEQEFRVEGTVNQSEFPTEIELPILHGAGKNEKASLKQLFGEHPTLIVNLWATWCPPCIDELPSLEYLGRQLGKLDAKVTPRLVTISVDEGTAEISELFSTLDYQPRLPVLHDSQALVAQACGTFRFPETYWIDRKGKILHKWVGPQDWLSDKVVQRLTSQIPANP